MVITWYGQSCFKIQSGDKTFVIDPFAKQIGLAPPNIQADVVFVTHDHSDHNNTKVLKGEPFIINGPGEYELRGIKAWGLESFHDEEEGAKRGLNTIYLLEVEGIRVLHLGDLGQGALSDKQIEGVGRVDILMIPVGGTFTIDAKQSMSIINQVEPKIVIPMHYKVPRLTISELASLDDFLEEFGDDKVSPIEKLTIKTKDFSVETGKAEVVVLKI